MKDISRRDPRRRLPFAADRLGGLCLSIVFLRFPPLPVRTAPPIAGVLVSKLPMALNRGIGPLHRWLRSATRSDLMAIDRITSQLDLARREDYGLFLNVHYWTLNALSPYWRERDRIDFLALAACLQGDLHSLGFAASNPDAVLHSSMTADHSLGISFVIRGARFGSNTLRDRVSPRFSARYLDFSPGLSWPCFLRQLEQHVFKRSEQDGFSQVISGAKQALAAFSNGLQLILT
jgi:heme oxygenase